MVGLSDAPAPCESRSWASRRRLLDSQIGGRARTRGRRPCLTVLPPARARAGHLPGAGADMCAPGSTAMVEQRAPVARRHARRPSATPPTPIARMAKADNTRRAYRAAVRAWCAWCARHDLPPLPAAGADVAAFLAGERGRELSPETLKLRRAAIRYLHRAAGCPVPTDDVASPRPWPASAARPPGKASPAQEGRGDRRPSCASCWRPSPTTCAACATAPCCWSASPARCGARNWRRSASSSWRRPTAASASPCRRPRGRRPTR